MYVAPIFTTALFGAYLIYKNLCNAYYDMTGLELALYYRTVTN